MVLHLPLLIQMGTSTGIITHIMELIVLRVDMDRLGSPSKLLQRIKLLGVIQDFTEIQLDSGKLHVYLSFYYQTWHGGLSIDDIVKVDVTFRTNTSDILGGIHMAELICRTSNSGWCHYSYSTSLPAGTRSIYYVMLLYKNDGLGGNIDAYIDDNSLIIL